MARAGRTLPGLLNVAAVLGCALATAGLSRAEAARRQESSAQQPALVQLQIPGSRLRAYVSPSGGAELVGLELHQDGRWLELLYRGMDFRPTRGWSGRAPILWPAVGRNFVGGDAQQVAGAEQTGWSLHGKIFPLSIHGFARDLPWRVVSRGSCEGSAFVRLELDDNDQTRRSYPFGFRLVTEYRLWKASLSIRQTVRSDPGNGEKMPFSIGNHITLRIPLVPGSEPGSMAITTPATQQVITDHAGRPTGQVVSVDYAAPRRLNSLAPLTPVSLSGYPEGGAWVRISDPSGLAVTIEHTEERRPPGVPVLFNLWGDVANGYFAPEPWVGKQNSLSSGDGVITLAPGETYQWVVAVDVAENGRPTPAAPDTIAAPTCQ
jgi:galactose mutarotase-like enzyme